MAYAWSNGGTTKKEENKYSWNAPLPTSQPKTKYSDEKVIDVKKIIKPVEVRKPSYNRLEKIESQPIAKPIIKPVETINKNKKVVQQGKVPIEGIKKVDNPFAPLIVNAANTATFGLLERNNKGIDYLRGKAPISSTIGSMAGYIAPGAAGAKLLKPLTSKIAKPLAKRVVEGMAVGGSIEAVSGAVGDRGLEQTKKNVGLGLALGGAADLGLYGIGKGINKLIKKPTGSVLPTSNTVEPTTQIRPKLNLKMQPKIEAPVIQQPMKINNAKGNLKSNLKNVVNKPKINEEINAYINGKNMPIFKNADADQTWYLRQKFKEEFPNSKDMQVRTIFDADGNSYKWMAGDALHNDVQKYFMQRKSLKVDDSFAPPLKPKQANMSTFKKSHLKPKLKPQSSIEIPSTNTLVNNNLPINEPLQSNLSTGKSRFANVTLEESANSTKQFKQDLNELDLGYDKITNETSLKQANMRIDNDLEKAVKYVLDTKEGSAEHTTTAIQLINKFQKEGNYERAIDIASDISSKLSKNGQAIQAASIYDRLSPEGILLYAQKQVNKLNDERWFKGLTKEQKINPELAKQLQELSANMKNLTGDAKIEASQELQQVLQGLGKPTLLRKIESAQTIGQLLNPKTINRNIISNELFYRVERFNKYIASPIDFARSAITGGERTITFKTGGQGGYWNGFIKGAKAGWKGVNPGGLQTQYDLTAPAFSGKWNPMTYLEKTLGATLKGFDYAAYTRAVNQTIGEMGELAAINSKIIGSAKKTFVQEFAKNANKNILDMADQYGKYVTFQDNNILSQGLSAVKKGLNLGKEFGAGSLVIKYPKTPGALIMRGLDYSAAGFLKSAYTVAKPFLQGGKIDTRKATMELSRAITGTLGFTGLGYLLADKGVITGRVDKDKDVRELQKQTGAGSYKVNLTALERWAKSRFDMKALELQPNDTMFSYDWAAPISMAISFGANINSNLKENKDALNSASSVLASGVESSLNTVAEQPVLQGLARQFQGYDLGQNVTNTLKSVPSSFTPTAFNQIRQFNDNTGRFTYDPSPLKESFNMAKVKVPGLSSQLPVAYDTEGKEKQNFQNNSNNFLNVFLNPGFVTKNNPTPTQKEVLRIFETTGLKTQFPSVAPKNIPKTSTAPQVNLTGSEVQEYQRLIGRNTLSSFKNVMNTTEYRIKDDEQKAKLLSNAIADAKQSAKMELLGKLNLEGRK